MLLSEYLLERETICLQADAQNWQEAVALGTDLLEDQKSITSDYCKAIFENMTKLGPYFILAPGIAMPHARPEQGVIDDSFALVTLQHPVNFGDQDNDPIDILVTMAAKSAEVENTQSIVQIMELLDDEERVAKLRAARDIKDIQEIFLAMEENL